MNRRDFVTSTAALAATAAAGPLLLGVEDKAGAKAPRVGSGEHVYEWVPEWANMPNGLEWQTTHNVAIDSQGNVAVTQQGIGNKSIDTVFVFDTAGKFVRSFGKGWYGGGHGIDVRKDGGEEFYYLCNTWKEPKVVKATLKGETVWEMERPDAKEYADPKVKYNPTNIAFTPDGGFFIGDGYGSNYVLKYDKDRKLTSVFGGTGTADGKFKTPHGNWTDLRDPAKPTLVVCDRANARLQTFDLDGKHLSTTEKGVVLFPANVDRLGDLLLVPDLHARVTLLGKDNKVVAQLGDDPAWLAKVQKENLRSKPKEWVPGKFIHPHDACFLPNGDILVAEWVSTGRITRLKKV
jgi:DNA-binding beta-propeller fold protein YncE